MVMIRPPAYHPGNFLMKNMNPTNSGLSTLYAVNYLPPNSCSIAIDIQPQKFDK